MKQLYIMRGIPGAGKSTWVKEFISNYPHYKTAICSADDYFLQKDGSYNFDPKKLKHAHQWCKSKAEAAMLDDYDLVIIDNTNTRYWEYEPYVKLAEKYGYNWKTMFIGSIDKSYAELYAKRNKHGVPKEKIEQMMDRFEV